MNKNLFMILVPFFIGLVAIFTSGGNWDSPILPLWLGICLLCYFGLTARDYIRNRNKGTKQAPWKSWLSIFANLLLVIAMYFVYRGNNTEAGTIAFCAVLLIRILFDSQNL